ncbi:MAG: outer membrane beta-barrel protein [Bacteroidales bacterium]|jgi:hypothetical protein|nr:outer membrane beta-barrel protein [Bacteroidales bacterium]
MRKNNVIKTLFVGLILISTCTGAFAQKTGLSLHLGGIFPAGDFKTPKISLQSGTATVDGSTTTGASLGLRYNVKLPLGFNVFAHAELVWNSLDKETKDQYKEISKTIPQYVNVPLFAGVRYHLSLFKIVGIYGEAGLGANILMKTREGWKDNIVKYKNSTKFATEFGVGITAFNFVSLGIHYYLLGDHTISVKEQDVPTQVISDENINVRMWALKLAILF